MALNLFRSSLLTTNNRQLIITLINIRTHFTKTPNHHTKPKWRPFRRAKVLDVCIYLNYFIFLIIYYPFRSIYLILIKIENYVHLHSKNKENFLNVKVFLLFAVLNINHYISMLQVNIFQ
jgi:hypothetical protein